MSQRVKKKVTLRHSLDGEPGSTKAFPLEESTQETSPGSFRDGHSVKNGGQPESPALSVVMHSPVLSTTEQQTSGTIDETFTLDVPEDEDIPTELPFEDTPQAASETSWDSSQMIDGAEESGDNEL